ncbi:MAG: 16S rRNA (uracil(1498)-N(3))-methyltransferase [Candidatus Yonathbacteria bacterium]|nr:16S rRNA (uracil(1498)-N(3))-methyltransferase [Candidatus Yonathbacteria bacterium]
MRLHWFFVETEIPQVGEFLVANETLLNQWRNVLRMEVGDEAILFDGRGDEFLCEFVSLEKKGATLKVLERKAGLIPSREVTLYMALIKKDNFELVLEKATELGVSHIIPVQADRSEKKGLNYERAQKILREASEQSGRAMVPILGKIIDIEKIPTEGLVVFDPRGEKLAREFFTAGQTAPISLLIGPEGGFTDAEMELFQGRNIPIVTTGEQILRAETAAIVALTLALV